MRTVTVVGASLAGLRAVEQLRSQGFDGRVTVVGDEPHPPYDRPPLTKSVLARGGTPAELALAEPPDLDELAADWLLGVPAARLDTAARTLVLADGRRITTDGVVVATGGRARTLPGADGLRGVHTVRTLDDALALREDLVAAQGPAVVVGAGWIGAETASACRTLGLDVTVVEADPAPLARALGPTMAAACTALHTDHGTTLRLGTGVRALTSTSRGTHRRVTGVELDDGTTLPAAVVVVGVGMRPATDWLAGSDVPLDDGVLCDDGGATAIPAVVAAGDVARYRSPEGVLIRHEHWTSATEQPATAVRNLLAGRTVESHRPSGYVWSDQYGTRIQVCGRTAGADEVETVSGAVADRRFVAAYRSGGRTTGVLAMNDPKGFTRLRRGSAAVPA